MRPHLPAPAKVLRAFNSNYLLSRPARQLQCPDSSVVSTANSAVIKKSPYRDAQTSIPASLWFAVRNAIRCMLPYHAAMAPNRCRRWRSQNSRSNLTHQPRCGSPYSPLVPQLRLARRDTRLIIKPPMLTQHSMQHSCHQACIKYKAMA